MFFQAAFYLEDSGPGANAILPFNMWIPQIAIGITFLVLNILVVMELPKGAAMF